MLWFNIVRRYAFHIQVRWPKNLLFSTSVDAGKWTIIWSSISMQMCILVSLFFLRLELMEINKKLQIFVITYILTLQLCISFKRRVLGTSPPSFDDISQEKTNSCAGDLPPRYFSHKFPRLHASLTYRNKDLVNCLLVPIKASQPLQVTTTECVSRASARTLAMWGLPNVLSPSLRLRQPETPPPCVLLRSRGGSACHSHHSYHTLCRVCQCFSLSNSHWIA